MLERHEFEGYWWLPQDGADGVPPAARSRLAGRLTIADGRAELAVLENFGHEVLSEGEHGTVFSPMPAEVPRVLGLSADGKAITLESCRPVSAPMSFPGISRATYRAQVALVGVWFAENETISFDEICLRTAALNTWVGVTGFSQEVRFEVDDGGSIATGIESAELQFSPPDRIDIELADGAQAWIDFSYSVPGVDQLTTKVTFQQEARLHLRPAEPASLSDVFRVVGQLRNLISLAVGQSDTVISVTGYRDDLRQGKTNSLQPIGLHWQVPRNAPPVRSVHPVEMLFTLKQAEPDIATVLRKWLAHYETFEPVLNLYFGVLHHPDLYLEVRFLAYAQALETYDFRRRDPYELDSAAHKARMTSILEGSPEEWRDWLKMRLASSNYWTLDQRIRSVLAESPEVSGRIVGATSAERDKFVRAFKNSRNYYTHYTPRLERHAAKGVALHLLVVQLRAVLEMSLLRELGFSAESIDKTLERCDRYRQIDHFRELAVTDQNA